MLTFTYNDWMAAADLGDDKAQLEETIAKNYAERIREGAYSLPQLITDLGPYVHADLDLVSIARALALLPPVFALIESPSKHEIHTLVEYFSTRLRNEDSLPSFRSGVRETASCLLALAKWPRFIPGDAKPIMEAIFTLDNGTQFSSLAPASRIAIFELVDFLVKKHSSALKRDFGSSEPLITGIVSLVELEKNPSCLGIIFPLYAYLGKQLVLEPADLEKIWDSYIRYYPITLGGGSRDPAIPTKELLRENLLQCILSNDGYAKHAFPYFIDRLDANSDISANIKTEVFQTIVSCIDAYSLETISEWSAKLWDSLKFEIWNGENDDFINSSLKVLRSIGTSLSAGPYDFADHKDPLGKYILAAATECSSRLHDSKKQYALPSGRILHAIATSSPYGFYLVIKTVLPTLLVLWQDLKLDSERKMILTVFNNIVSAKVDQSGTSSNPTSGEKDSGAPKYLNQTFPKMEAAFQEFRDGLVEVYSGVVSEMKRSESSKDISYGVPAIQGLALLFQLPQYLSEVEMAMAAQELNSLALRPEPDIHAETLKALQQISSSEPEIFKEITLPNFVGKLPIILDSDPQARKKELDVVLSVLQDLVMVACSAPCRQSRAYVSESTYSSGAGSYWHRNFNTLIERLLQILHQTLQSPGQQDYARTIIGVICVSLESFDQSLDEERNTISSSELEPKATNSAIHPYSYIVFDLFRIFSAPKPYSSGSYKEANLWYSAISNSPSDNETFDDLSVQLVGKIANAALRSKLTTLENNFLLAWDKSLPEGAPSSVWTLFCENIQPNIDNLGLAQMDLMYAPPEKSLANVLSTYLIAGLRPESKTEIQAHFPIGETAAAMIRNAISTNNNASRLSRLSMLWMLQLLVNKFSATTHKLANGPPTLLKVMEDYVESSSSKSPEEVNNIYQTLSYFAAASLTAFDKTMAPLINLMVQGISDPKHGRKVAQSFRILLAPSEVMNKENFCKIRALRHARLLQMTTSLYQSWKASPDPNIKVNYLIAYAGILGYIPTSLLIEESKPTIEGFLPLLLSGTAVKNDDFTKKVFINLILSILPLCPDLITEHLDSVINRMTDRTHNTYDSPSDSSVSCRALALEVLGRLTEVVDVRELNKRRRKVVGELELAKDDCSRVVRKRAEQARCRWMYLDEKEG